MSQKIRIKLKSYDHNLVDKSADKIVKTVKTTGAVVTGPIPLPTHKKILQFCVHHMLTKNQENNLNLIPTSDFLIYIVHLQRQLMH